MFGSAQKKKKPTFLYRSRQSNLGRSGDVKHENKKCRPYMKELYSCQLKGFVSTDRVFDIITYNKTGMFKQLNLLQILFVNKHLIMLISSTQGLREFNNKVDKQVSILHYYKTTENRLYLGLVKSLCNIYLLCSKILKRSP